MVGWRIVVSNWATNGYGPLVLLAQAAERGF